MVKCAAFGCRSGYVSKVETEGSSAIKVTFHAFPLKDEELCQKWVHANPRINFVPTKYSKLCSLHFKHSDFVEDRRDSNARRRKSLHHKLSRKHLKDGVVPSIFPNAPPYLSAKGSEPRWTSKATAESRFEHGAMEFDRLEKSFIAEDDISELSLTDLQSRLNAETTAPSGFTLTLIDEALHIYLLDVTDDIPVVKASIAVKKDHALVLTDDGKKIPASKFKDLVKGPLKHMSQLLNLMARIKNWSEDPHTRSLELQLQMTVQCLNKCLSDLDDEQEEYRKIKFAIEQLELIAKPKYGRQYSPQLTIFSYMVYASNSSAYETLRNEKILCLPSVSTLRKVTRRLNVNEGLNNINYLKLRVAKLNEFQRNVVLMIDEIYVAKRVEYSGGEVQGLTPDGSVASTLLCFMIKSVVGKFKDLVGIYPMSKLTSAKQHACYVEVMTLLRNVNVNVVAISVDNASTNRKFFVDFLCGGTLQTNITDAVTGQPIYLIFDPVHDIKNVYNNFQKRKKFECPEMARNLPAGCTADFQHIVDLFTMEANMSLKKAHRLTPAALEPKSIEKTSVKLATSVFSESTRDALEFYAANEDKSEWTGTAAFIALIIKVWNVMNVKSSSKGKHKRDITMDPIRSSLDWKLDFLREFADFLQRWEQSKKPGLTRETFVALRQTCLALVDCSCHLLDHRGYKYVLLGSLQSDAIESRFGWLRQLSGANYYISTRQVLESDRKIRALSLLKFSGISLTDIDSVLHIEIANRSQSDDDKTADTITEALQFDRFPSASDANIIFYVSGYIARSIIRTTKCDHCKESLVTTDPLEPIELDDRIEYSAATFLDAVNRGGLSRPTDFTFQLTLHCWRVFEEVKSTSALMEQLISSTCQRRLFGKVMDRASCIQTFGNMPIDSNFCVSGHDLNTMIGNRFFNCVAKNFVKDLNNKANPQSALPAKKRKISKLSGSTESH
jgi:THAP domain/Transposase protein